MPKSESHQVSASQRVWIAVLGKHPGWNDHLDDIGLDTERLVAVKRHLYVEGVGGAINAGTWEALSEQERDEGFSHTFFWRQADGMVIGRMWSSSDGKGRSKYPMIACAMCRSLPFSFVAGPLLERLRRLEAVCREVTTASDVIGAVDRVKAEVAELASFAPELSDAPVAGGESGKGSASELIESGRLGEDGVGLKRVLYQMDREMGAYVRPEGSGTASRSRSVEVRGQHIRVPTSSGSISPGQEHRDLSLWARLLLNKIDPLVPIFLATKDGRDWVDIIVGELGPTPLACLQSSPEAMPYVSDIPFTIDGDIEQSIEQTIEASRAGTVVERDPCYVDVPQERLAPFLRPRRAETSSAETDRKPLFLGIGAAAIVVVIVLAFLLMRGDGDGEDQPETREQSRAEPADEPAATELSDAQTRADPVNPAVTRETPPGSAVALDDQATEPVPADSPIDRSTEAIASDPVGRLEAFERWCARYEVWYLPFTEAIEDAAIAGDPVFAKELKAAIASAKREGDRLDPLINTPGRYRSLDSLRASPPDAIYEPGFGETIAAGLGPIEMIREVMQPSRWESRASLSRLAVLTESFGGAMPDDLSALSLRLDSDNGSEAAGAVLGLAGVSDGLGASVSAMDQLIAVRGELESIPDDSVARAFVRLSPIGEEGSGNTWLAEARRRALELVSLGEELLGAAESGYPRVDPELFEERIAALSEATALAYLRGWIETTRDRSLYLLDPADDPRRGLSEPERVAALREGLRNLAESDDNAETRELTGLLDAYDEAASELRDLSWNEATKVRVSEETGALTALLDGIADRIDAESRSRAIEAERYIATLNATETVTNSGSDAIDRAWITARDAAVDRFESDGDVVAFSRAIDTMKENLASLESAMPRPKFDDGALGTLSVMFASTADEERERVLSDLITTADAALDDDAIVLYNEWREKIVESSGSLVSLRHGLDTWDDREAREAAEQWGGAWAAANMKWRAEAPELGRYIEALESPNPVRLGEIAQSSDSQPGIAFVAWSRLDEADPEWGTSIEQLELDRVVTGRLAESVATLPEVRAAEVTSSMSRSATARWLRGASSCDAAEFSRIAAIGGDLPLAEDQLPAGVRFNLFVEGLRRSLDRGEPLDREELVAQAESARAGLDEGGSASAWLASFVDELTAREGREIDYRVIGPARSGWAVEPFDSGRVLRYSWTGADQPRELTFRLVESPEAGVFYLAETEAPAWLMTDFVLNGEHAEAVSSSLPEDWDPIPDTRLGPRVWDWGRQRGGRGIRVARTWVMKDRGSDRPYYADGFEDRVGRPGDDHPIQRVSARAAASIAAAAGCRLPTQAEWRAAFGTIGSPPPSADWNLRDRTFDEQRSHTLSLGAGLAVTWPDQQSFVDGMDGIGQGPDAESHDWSDGVLWFTEVAAGRERPFRHLLGNVAEYVLPETNDTAWLSDRGGDVGSRVRALGTVSRVLPVIGGSSLSPPGVGVDRAVVPATDTGVLGYSDVGFRLAFSPGVEAPLVVVVGELLGDAPFLRMAD